MSDNKTNLIRLFLCGDVMTGRGIDQVLPSPSNPVLYEPYVRNARRYVELAESVNGPIPHPVEFDYIWGDALKELDRAGVDVRIINLETSITCSEDYWPDKKIHYRMHPRNISCITVARIDCCCLANNHTLDWGYDGLAETLRTLDAAHVAHAGAGRDAAEAAAPAVLDVPGKGRLFVFSYGSPTSGIPWEWGASSGRPGVNLLMDTSEETARRIAREMCRLKTPNDVIVTSIHWGENWGYDVRDEQIRFTHRLVEEGVDIVHSHSSHHVKTTEIYNGRLVLYGCGDFLNDYEGIGGYEAFRSDLALMYLAAVEPEQGQLMEMKLVPMQIKRFQLKRVSETDAKWLCDLLNHLGMPLDTRVDLAMDNTLALHPFTQMTGSSRATLRARRARSAASTTALTSL